MTIKHNYIPYKGKVDLPPGVRLEYCKKIRYVRVAIDYEITVATEIQKVIKVEDLDSPGFFLYGWIDSMVKERASNEQSMKFCKLVMHFQDGPKNSIDPVRNRLVSKKK